MQVIIMRGLPGSGKTTWVNKWYKEARVFSTDHKFMVGSMYCFDRNKLAEYHNETLSDYTWFMTDKTRSKWDGTVVVDNTNLKVWEIAPYYRIAEALDASVSITYMHCSPFVAAQRCVHEVPHEVVVSMWKGIEPLPQHWNVSVV
jgi:predicted kinase